LGEKMMEGLLGSGIWGWILAQLRFDAEKI